MHLGINYVKVFRHYITGSEVSVDNFALNPNYPDILALKFGAKVSWCQNFLGLKCLVAILFQFNLTHTHILHRHMYCHTTTLPK